MNGRIKWAGPPPTTLRRAEAATRGRRGRHSRSVSHLLGDMIPCWEVPKRKRSARKIQPSSSSSSKNKRRFWGRTKPRSVRGRYGNLETTIHDLELTIRGHGLEQQPALTIHGLELTIHGHGLEQPALTINGPRMSDPLATADAAVHSSSPAAAEASCPPAPARSRRIPTIYTHSPALSLALAANREQAEDFFLPYFDTFAINQAPQYSGSQFVDMDAVATYHNRMQGQSFTSLLTSSNTELLWRQEILRGQQQQHTMGFQLSRAVTETQYNEIGANRGACEAQPEEAVRVSQQQQQQQHPQANDTGLVYYHWASPEFEAVSGAETHQCNEFGACNSSSSRGCSGACCDQQPQAPVTPEKRQPGRQQQQQGDHHLQAKNTDTMGCHCASPEFELSRAVSGAETHQYREIGASSRGVSGTCDQPQAPVTPEKKQPKKTAAATAQGRKRPLKVPGQSPSNAPIDLLQQQQVPKNSFDLNELPERPRKHRPRVAKDKPPKTPRKRGRPRKQQQEDPTGQQQPPRPYIPTSTVEILVSSYVSNSSSSNARMEWELTHGVQGQANKRKGRSSLAGESQKKRTKADGGLQSQPSHNRGYDVLNRDALRGLNDEALELVYLMEKLIEGMEKMHLDSEGGLEIVEYKGFSGPVVPFMPPKKKKPRAKVVLDMETNRMWNLLMIKGAKEEHVDQDSAKRWEQDRLMMEQKAELFISRMHLVQGNRCFSKWKGSVVDSVVGAFLTQNVSDHLSSSAFMSVASRFPIKKDSQKLGTEGCIPQNCGQCLRTSTPRKEEVRIKVQARGKKQQNSHGVVLEEDNLYKQEGAGSRAKRALFAAEPEEESKEEVNTEEEQVFIQEPVEIGNSYVVQIDDSNSTSMLQEFCSGSLSKVDNVANASGGTEEGAFTGIPSLDDNMALQYKQKQSLGMNNAANLVASEKQQSLGMNTAANLGGNFVVASEKQQQSLGMNSAANLNIEGGQTVVALEKQQQSLGTNSVGNLNIEGGQTVVASEVPERLNGKMKPSGIDLAKLEQSQGTSKNSYKWDTLRSKVLKNQDSSQNEFFKSPTSPPPDSLDWEAVRLADVKELADVIKERGMNNVLAGRIKAFLERVHEEHGTINLEWLREIPPEDAKEFLLSIRGLGLKSVECIRLLTLEHLAFPVDTNVGRICVRLGWVPIEPLPEELQLHLLELYPVQATIQKYLWPRLCTLDQRTLYELHYQMITFGKVFCTKSKPNCNACPMRQDCKHFASAFASARLALPAPAQQNGDQEEESSLRLALAENVAPLQKASASEAPETVIRLQNVGTSEARERCEPIIEEPTTPEPCSPECPDIEDYPLCLLDEDSILKINLTELGETDKGKETAAGQSSKALVLVPPEFAYIPVPKLKNEGRLRTVHYVYELPDNHPLLYEMEARETDDPCYYLLAIWSPGEEAGAPPTLSECDYSTFADVKESNDETVKGTLLVPCRSAMRGNFPLNGTYFQVNEVFADQATSLHPMDVPRASLWNLRRRFVYFGTSVTSIFRGLTTEEIQACFWRGYVCVRGFDQKTRAPRPLAARFHLPASFKRVAAKKTANGN